MFRICLAIGVLPTLAYAQDPPAKKPSRAPVVLSEQALKIHADMPVIDGHNDLPWELRRKDDMASFKTIDIARLQPKLHTDLIRLKKGGVGRPVLVGLRSRQHGGEGDRG